MKRKKTILLLADLGLVAAVLATPWLTGWMIDSWPACWATEFGWLCPACGGTRCVRFLAQGRIWEALQSNWYMCLLLAYGGTLLVLAHLAVFARLRVAKKAVNVLCKDAVPVALCVGFALFGILRNFL